MDFDRRGAEFQGDYSLQSLRKLLGQANRDDTEKGWCFGPSSYVEMRAIIDRMPDAPPKADTHQVMMPTIDDGGLTSYLLARCEAPTSLSIGFFGSVFPLTAGLSTIQDVVRTKRFLLGVEEAISKLDEKQERIEVVDAGAGPVALLGIYAALCSPKVHVTCLELCADSVDFARKVVKKFGLEDRVKVLLRDAVAYSHDKPVDLLVSETMHVGLSKEPMVQIMGNFRSQMSEGGLMLPSEVVVKACAVREDQIKNPQSWVFFRYTWNPVVQHEWTTGTVYRAGDDLALVQVQVDISKLPPGKYVALISSDIQIGSQRLTDYESVLSLPVGIGDEFFGEKLQFEIAPNGVNPATIAIAFTPGGTRLGQLLGPKK